MAGVIGHYDQCPETLWTSKGPGLSGTFSCEGTASAREPFDDPMIDLACPLARQSVRDRISTGGASSEQVDHRMQRRLHRSSLPVTVAVTPFFRASRTRARGSRAQRIVTGSLSPAKEPVGSDPTLEVLDRQPVPIR